MGRSYFAMDEVSYQPWGNDVLHSYVFGWGKGHLGFLALPASQPATFHVYWQSWHPCPPEAIWMVGGNEVFDLLGVRVCTEEASVMRDTTVRIVAVAVAVYVPCWLAALSAALPAIWMMRWDGRRARVARRREAGCCVRCGYDLRATPEQWPECGAVESPARMREDV